MSIVEYTGPSTPQEIRKYLMARTKDEIVWEYLRQRQEFGKLEAYVERLKAAGEKLSFVAGCVSQESMDWTAICEESPTTTTSLTRPIAEWQAEALEEAAKRIREECDDVAHAEIVVEGLRDELIYQAEKGEKS